MKTKECKYQIEYYEEKWQGGGGEAEKEATKEFKGRRRLKENWKQGVAEKMERNEKKKENGYVKREQRYV